MQTILIETWTAFKALVASKKLLIQYDESSNDYKLYAIEGGAFIWATTLNKDSGTDVTDFETNFKPTANAPIENKADTGRPERIAPSPQPNNTTEKWKGFHLEIAANETTKTVDISFDSDIYLKGGLLYSDDCDCEDYVKADVVAKANPAYVVKSNILKDVYMIKNLMIPFMSSECMFLPATVMLRVTYTKGTPTDTERCISAMADYFEPMA
jgi:hypothetical protein